MDVMRDVGEFAVKGIESIIAAAQSHHSRQVDAEGHARGGAGPRFPRDGNAERSTDARGYDRSDQGAPVLTQRMYILLRIPAGSRQSVLLHGRDSYFKRVRFGMIMLKQPLGIGNAPVLGVIQRSAR